MHILAGDIGPRTNLQGVVYYNKSRLDPNIPLWQRCALVESRDEQYVFLTVRETVTFAMKLRCVAGEMDLDLVGESTKGVLETLHLDGCVLFHLLLSFFLLSILTSILSIV